jgi:hypothetical protein
MNVVRTCCRLAMAVLFAAAILFPVGNAQAGDPTLEKVLAQFNSDAAKGYFQPFADFVGANMNAGFFHSAAIPTTGFHIALDIVAMGSSVGDDAKSYTVKAPQGFSPAEFSTATMFGGKATVISDATNPSIQYRGISDGIFNTTLFPLATPQLRVGSLFGTEAVIRYVPIPETNGIPKSTMFTIGARHNVNQYLPDVPLDLAAGIFYSKYTSGDLIDASGFAFGVQASKSFEMLTVYGGLESESSKMNLKYVDTPGAPPTVDINLDGVNSFRFTVGAGVSLGVFGFFADANFGSVTNFSGGISFGN